MYCIYVYPISYSQQGHNISITDSPPPHLTQSRGRRQTLRGGGGAWGGTSMSSAWLGAWDIYELLCHTRVYFDSFSRKYVRMWVWCWGAMQY